MLTRLLAVLIAVCLPTSLLAAIGLGVVPVPSGGGSTTLTNAVAINSGSTLTNVPFTIGVPLSAAAGLDASHHIQASDSTNGVLPCGEDNRASDLTPNIRVSFPKWNIAHR
jgi:hypothetical protein